MEDWPRYLVVIALLAAATISGALHVITGDAVVAIYTGLIGYGFGTVTTKPTDSGANK